MVKGKQGVIPKRFPKSKTPKGFKAPTPGLNPHHAATAITQQQSKEATQQTIALVSADIHKQIAESVQPQIADGKFAKAASEAVRVVFAYIQCRTELTDDGERLLNAAMPKAENERALRINAYQTETEKSQAKGFKNLLLGLYGFARNPAAHDLQLQYEISAEDCYDILRTASMALRKLEGAQMIPPRITLD